MDGEAYGDTADTRAHPGLAARERGTALARADRATREQRLRQAAARQDPAGVLRLRPALLLADRRAKRLGGVLSRARRRLSERLRAGRAPPGAARP